MEKKNFSAASVLVAMLIASGHFAQASASKDDYTSGRAGTRSVTERVSEIRQNFQNKI